MIGRAAMPLSCSRSDRQSLIATEFLFRAGINFEHPTVVLFDFFSDKRVFDDVDALVKCAPIVNGVVAESATFVIKDTALDVPVMGFAEAIDTEGIPDFDFFAPVVEGAAFDFEVWFAIGGLILFCHAWRGVRAISLCLTTCIIQ